MGGPNVLCRGSGGDFIVTHQKTGREERGFTERSWDTQEALSLRRSK